MKNQSYWLFELHKDGSVHYRTDYSCRFADDKVKAETNSSIVLADGIVLNKKELKEGSPYGQTLFDYYKHCYETPEAIKQLIGPFVAVVYNKEKGDGIAFANQTGDASVFYGYNKKDGTLVLSNNFNAVFDKCKPCNVNEKAAHYLLTYGFIVDDSTIADGIYRLQAGKFLRFDKQGVKVEQYHRFNFHDKIEITLDEAVEKVDVLFRNAVKRCFEKDIEYGYHQHLADMSAGLDSRMTNVVANDLGYTNIVNISYSQFGSDEQKIAQQVSLALGHPLYHRSLDDATFIYDMKETIAEEYGMAYAHGFTGGRQFLRLIDFDKFGLEHTGQIGDVVVSQFFPRTSPFTDSNLKRMSGVLPQRFPLNANDFVTNEEFAFYTRAFQGALSTHYIREKYTYAVSPFLDPELLEFCASLPDEIRASHRLYWSWIDRKYPAFGKIPSSRKRQYRGMGWENAAKLYSGKLVFKAKRRVRSICYQLGLTSQSISANDMNPHQYWYDTNERLRKFIADYYQENHFLVAGQGQLEAECKTMFESSSAFDKLLCISLLETLNVYFNIKNNK